MEGIIISRIDSLEPTAQLVLKVASIIGYSFSLHILAAVFPVKQSVGTLLDHLMKIAQCEDILSVNKQSESFRFAHHTVREVVYNLLLLSQRAELHRLVAQYWERTSPCDWPLIAHHWVIVAQTEEPPATQTVKKAIQCLLKSVAVSLEGGLYVEASSSCKTALDLLPKASEGDRALLENAVYFYLAQTSQLNEDSGGAQQFFVKAKVSAFDNQTFCFKKRKLT